MEGTEQLLPHVVDHWASCRPHELYAHIPKSYTSYTEGYRTVSWAQLANAVNGVAWLLSERLRKSDTFETLAYFGPNDIGYMIVILGAAKVGYSVLLPSPTLNRDGLTALLNTAECETILTLEPPYATAVDHILSGPDPPSQVIYIPTVFELLDGHFPHFPYEKSYEELQDKPLVMIHTSGTTGFPKPLVYTHRTSISFARELREAPPKGYYNAISWIQNRRVLTAFPFFHSGAVMVALFIAIHSRTTLVTPLAGDVVSTPNIIEVLREVEVDALCLPAPFVDQIAKNPEWLELVTSRVKEIGFSGADIGDATGKALVARGVRLANFFGSSETLTTPTIRPQRHEPADAWHYIEPHRYVNAHFEPHGRDSGPSDGVDSLAVSNRSSRNDLFELVFHRNPEPDRTQPVFTIFPDLQTFPTRDLFSPHPTHPDLWRFRGRADDMLTSASGELTNPLAFEQQVTALAGVGAALVVGDGRWRKALLLEPASTQRTTNPGEGRVEGGDDAAWVDALWPEVEDANRLLSRTSRIARSHVLVTAPGKQMCRTAKGTVMRRQTVGLYAAELEELYRRNGEGEDAAVVPLPVHFDMRR